MREKAMRYEYMQNTNIYKKKVRLETSIFGYTHQRLFTITINALGIEIELKMGNDSLSISIRIPVPDPAEG